jgi:hypothetical protein
MYGHAGGYSQFYKHGNVRALGSRHVNPIQSSYTYYIYTHLTTGGETYIEHSGLLLLTALQPSGHYLCYYAPDYQRREHADDTCARVLLGMKLLRLLLFLAAVPGSIELFHQVLNSGRGLLQIDTNGL